MFELADVREARRQIEPYVRRTPLVKSATLSQELGTNVYLKQELFQKTGSFKPRGAFNQMLALPSEQRERGVVAVSGGNFAQGVAYAGQVLGLRTLICMPDYTPKNYLEATRSYGAEIELVPTIAEAFERVEAYQRQGYGSVHPFDNPYMMAGNGTIGLELLEDLPEMTDVFISVGGGGLLGGNIVSIKALKPQARIWAVETEGADALGRALQAGQVVQMQPTSLAKTLGSPYAAETTLVLAQRHLERHLLVSDREAYQAQVHLLERTKLLTELAASCTLAAARRVQDTFRDSEHVVLLLCGGNVSLENLVEYHRLFQDGDGRGKRQPL
jgi:threonine dehydratase